MTDKDTKVYTMIEGNLIEYPIFSMQRSRHGRQTEDYLWQDKNFKGDVIAERRLKVQCVDGVPNFFDMDIFNALMRIYTKGNHPNKNEIYFTIYDLIIEANLPMHSGKAFNDVRASLERMSKTTLHFDDAFYEDKRRVTRIIDLIVRVEIEEKHKGKRLINVNKVVLDDVLVASIERNYFKLIDWNIYNSLSSGLPRRLFSYLEKKKFRKTEFVISISKLAITLGLKSKKLYVLKKLFTKTNKELKEKQTIHSWKYDESKVIYYFNKSDAFNAVDKDLFYIDSLVATFYESLGHKKVSSDLLREGVSILQSLIEERYTHDELQYALSWAVDNIKDIRSIRIIPKVISQALGARDSKDAIAKQANERQQQAIEEQKDIEEQTKQAEKLDRIFSKLHKDKQDEIAAKAMNRLFAQGIKKDLITQSLLRVMRNEILIESGFLNLNDN